MSVDINTVGVVGAGTMGSGLAQLAAESGFKVVLFDASRPAMDTARKRVESSFAHAISKGKLTVGQADHARSAIVFAENLSELGSAQAIIEAVSEDIRIKQRVFRDLGRLPPDILLATNTSSLPVWAMAQAATHPSRVVGMHFFNPPVLMKLVEIARTPHTEAEYFQAAWNLALRLKKVPVEVKDTPGFIVNRVLRPYYLQALRLANQGVPIQDIDNAAREIGKAPMGPCELMDLIGLDVNLSITRVIYESLGRPERLRPSTIQEWLVNAGATGRKARRGFYLYKDSAPPVINPEVLAILPEPAPLAQEELWRRLMNAIYEEAVHADQEKVASREAIDTAVKLATNLPLGPFEWQKSQKESRQV